VEPEENCFFDADVSIETLFLLDTTVLVDVSRDRDPATNWLRETIQRQRRIGVSAVSVAEFFSGLLPEKRPIWLRFLEDLTHFDVTLEIALQAGILRYDLARRGRAIQIPDAVIAATAATYGATLVTANIEDFQIPEIHTFWLQS
jgi:predicted nucleic acid-binding protein